MIGVKEILERKTEGGVLEGDKEDLSRIDVLADEAMDVLVQECGLSGPAGTLDHDNPPKSSVTHDRSKLRTLVGGQELQGNGAAFPPGIGQCEGSVDILGNHGSIVAII